MFCKNCGAQIVPNSVNCARCGTPIGVGNSFCPNCDAPTAPGAAFCSSCGVTLTPAPYPAAQRKSKIAAGLLGIFLGTLGIHNFYLGYTGKAVAQLLMTLLSCGALSIVTGIWGLVEGIMILTGSIYADANGIPLGN